MLKVILSVSAALAVLFLVGCGDSGTKYGKALTLNEPTKISDILKDPGSFDGKRVLVEGTITDVCEMMGCWIMIQGDDPAQAMRFKVDDGVIEFPMEVKGKTARAEGIVSVKMLTVDEQIAQGQHHADETGTEFDEGTVTAPKKQIQLNGEGAVII